MLDRSPADLSCVIRTDQGPEFTGKALDHGPTNVGSRYG